MSARTHPPLRLLLTCEHAGNRIPAPYRGLFRDAQEVLASHRGWDPGALALARRMARRLGQPLLEVRWSRLLVESNRSPHNPRIWSRYTAPLPRAERERILERYWWPHRRTVESVLSAAVAAGERVVHVGVHSFTPELDGEIRNADVTLLYDSGRPLEKAFAHAWRERLSAARPELRVRFNYPYLGTADGLTTWLRRRHPAGSYLGFELEVNQALLDSSRGRSVGEALAESLRSAVAAEATGPRSSGVSRARRAE